MIVDSPYICGYALSGRDKAKPPRISVFTGGTQGLDCWQNRNCTDRLEVEKPLDKPRSRKATERAEKPTILKNPIEPRNPSPRLASRLHRASKNAPNLRNSSLRKVAQAQFKKLIARKLPLWSRKDGARVSLILTLSSSDHFG